MDSSSVVSCIMSPESTVTSLLSSSGHLRSSLVVPDHNTTFRYRDKDYDSASEALDAYIADFESCRRNSKPLPGRLLVLQRPSCTPSKPRLSSLRNKDVLRERLTERELDFLKLPVSSLYHSVNRDRLSMTTDELLSIPHDGSMPVTHTSAFLQGLLNQSGASQPCLNSSALAHKNRDRLSSTSHTVPTPNQHHPHPGSSPRIIRRRHRAATLKPEVDFSSVSCNQSSHWAPGLERAELTTSIHPPHWFTSNNSEMDSSVLRDLKYPAWVSRCDLSEPPPPTELEPWEEQGFLPSAAPKTGAPSWVAELEDNLEQAHVDNQQTLRDLRLQFAEQISLLATERKSSHVIETLFRDNRIESLIQKADQVLNSLSRRSVGENCPADSAETRTQPRTQVCRIDCRKEAISPLDREESQLCSSSHRDSDTLESGTTAESVSEVLIGNGAQEGNAATQGRGISKQPGPAEALKQMLFRLQAVEAELHRQQLTLVASTATDRLHAEEYPVKWRPEAGEELESSHGGPSLQRALHHLGRLKQLVEEPRGKHGEEGKEEKDEDEGHYSSSSSERLICIPEKSST